MKKYYVSKKGYEKLYNDFLNVDNEINEANKKMGESAKLDNDLRENPEFMQLRVKAMYELPQKKEELRKKYEAATIIEDMDEYKNFDGSKIIIGTKVTLDFNSEQCTYRILGSEEGDLKNDILSCEAPLSKAILNKKTGDIINFNNSIIKILSVILI